MNILTNAHALEYELSGFVLNQCNVLTLLTSTE